MNVTKEEIKKFSEELEALASQIVNITDKVDGIATELNEIQEDEEVMEPMQKRPKWEKVGCYFHTGDRKIGFEFFWGITPKEGDVFVYNEGILWKLKNPKGRETV